MDSRRIHRNYKKTGGGGEKFNRGKDTAHRCKTGMKGGGGKKRDIFVGKKNQKLDWKVWAKGKRQRNWVSQATDSGPNQRQPSFRSPSLN